jgi:hypothetical protein
VRDLNDVHIEFSHIYGDQAFGIEQIQSIVIMNEMVKELRQEGKKVVTSILIDDYHAKYQLWSNSDELMKQVRKHGETPDIIALESAFVNIANEIISQIPASFKRIESFRKEKKSVLFFNDGIRKFALKDIYQDRERHKCVMLSCAWLFCKLGLVNFPEGSLQTTREVSAFQSHGVISILDKRYEKVEQNVGKLLSVLVEEKNTDRVQYIYY